MEMITINAQKNYDIVSELIFDTIQQKEKYNTIYVEFYKDNLLNNVIMLYDYSIKNVCDKMFEIYQTIRHYKVESITKIDTIYTTTLTIR